MLNFSFGWYVLDIFRSWYDFASLEGRVYRGVNVIGLIGDFGCFVKVIFVIIYVKDDIFLVVCYSIV